MSAGREQPGTAGSDVAVLEARGLGWAVRGKQILSAVDLKLRAGELVGVIGPNGAGKTTLLRLLTGVLQPTEGSVYLRGRPLGPLGPRARARSLAFMTQDVAQAFSFTVLEVLLMGRYPHLGRFEQESAEDRERARRTLSYVGLSGLEERSFSELSGGE
ncbi:MAG TPA: ABC transporter ATP-binding protein, partial [Spirochaetia bacterium]|nr:ABC transporter ATP-binding protein [Spirochaetia bacterium]